MPVTPSAVRRIQPATTFGAGGARHAELVGGGAGEGARDRRPRPARGPPGRAGAAAAGRRPGRRPPPRPPARATARCATGVQWRRSTPSGAAPSSSCGRRRRACTKLAAAISPTTTILTASRRPYAVSHSAATRPSWVTSETSPVATATRNAPIAIRPNGVQHLARDRHARTGTCEAHHRPPQQHQQADAAEPQRARDEVQPVVEDARDARLGRARVTRRRDPAERQHDRARRRARPPVAQGGGGDQRHDHQRAPDPGEVAGQVVAHPARVDPARGVGRVGDRRHHRGRHGRPREVAAQAPLARADVVEVDPAALVARVQVRHGPAARARDQQRQQQRRRQHQDRRVERDPGRDPHRAAAGQRPGLERRRRARVRAHAERERALQGVPVLGRDGVPVDPVGAGGQLARGRQDEPLAVLHGHGRRDRRAAAGRPQRRAREPLVERLGEHEHHARGRALQALAGRGLGADVGGVPVGARRPYERGEQGGWEREQAHPAESMPGSGRDLEAAHELVELLGGAGRSAAEDAISCVEALVSWVERGHLLGGGRQTARRRR